MPLRVQLLLLQVVIVLAVVSAAGVVAGTLQERQLRDAYLDRMTGVAQSVARLPAIRDALAGPDPSATIQPIAEVIRAASDVTYVVVTDDDGIRMSHPNADRIGERVSTDPSVPLAGGTYIGTQTGTLGESWRVKVPIYDGSGRTVIGSASVGILEAHLHADFREDLDGLLLALGTAAAGGVVCAWWVTRLVRRRIFKLEPEEISSLLETRDAMLHGISEGVVALDRTGRVALVNDEARRLLGLGPGEAPVGSLATDVLDGQLLELADRPGDHSSGELLLAGERVLLARANPATVDGRAVGAVLVLRDHTELHALLQDLDGARDLTDALRAQSHEFANKLHVVSGLLELGQHVEAVAFIERAGHGGLLTASAIAPGVHSPQVAALLLAKATTARERGIDLEVDPCSVLDAPCSPEATSLQQDVLTILGNTIDNAIDAAGPGGTVQVLVLEDAEELAVVVDDDGPGVPTALRAAVFRPGFSTKHASALATRPVRRVPRPGTDATSSGRWDALRHSDPPAPPPRPTPGTDAGTARGIGLALVRRVVARRGGAVGFTTSPLGGARLTLTLPVRPSTDAPAGASLEPLTGTAHR
ncbi:sensor histidine kinase [Oerskovia sp. Sa1BUA8]|uniref:histidine kinase n=1 Tax=Oerskovia douganii TaxID=2762210 RepID=A0A9D5YZE8_9CELL|nr:sensor histidine kinase [Oerskovia douganii]MBE7701663.1 sensor histidine kinase [Oerskovia douganii]